MQEISRKKAYPVRVRRDIVQLHAFELLQAFNAFASYDGIDRQVQRVGDRLLSAA